MIGDCLFVEMVSAQGDSMNTEESLWDIVEAAKYLKASKDTIYRWIDKKQMPALKVGKKWLFRREEIDGWLDSLNSTERNGGR